MRAVGKVWCEGPGAIVRHRRGADFRAVVEDVDDCAGYAITGNDRVRIIGGIAIDQRALDWADIVGGDQVGRRLAGFRIVPITILVVVDDRGGCGGQARQTQQQGPQGKACCLDHGGLVGDALPAQCQGRRLAVGHQQRAGEAFAIGTHVAVKQVVFGHAIELAIHALVEETFDGQIRLFAPFEGNLQVVADALDGDVLWRNVAIFNLEKILGRSLCLDLASFFESNFLGGAFRDCDQYNLFRGHS